MKVFDDGDVDKTNFIEMLLFNGVTLHGGSTSDCFQPLEEECQYTQKIVELCNNYNQSILFSTKTDTTYNVPTNPKLHSFQLSITHTTENNLIEPNVPPFNKRYQFYKKLIDEGYRVGIRIQPYIPSITDVENIIHNFNDANHFTLESVKLVPGNPTNEELLKKFNLKRKDFTQMGLLNLKPEIRLEYYEPIINLFEENGLSYSIADNDLHYIGNNQCCCGDNLIHKGIDFSNTSLIRRYGLNYTLEDVFNLAKDYLHCKCSSLYNSDRRNGCVTVEDFYRDRFDRKSAIFSPKLQYTDYDEKQTKLI